MESVNNCYSRYTVLVTCEDHELSSVIIRDLALSHESRLAARHSPLAIRDLAICDLQVMSANQIQLSKSQVTTHDSSLAICDLSGHKSRITSGE